MKFKNIKNGAIYEIVKKEDTCLAMVGNDKFYNLKITRSNGESYSIRILKEYIDKLIKDGELIKIEEN